MKQLAELIKDDRTMQQNAESFSQKIEHYYELGRKCYANIANGLFLAETEKKMVEVALFQEVKS